MLKECLDCTEKFSKRAKISVLLLLLCIFSGWGWLEGVGAFCDPLPAGWMQWGCGNGSLSSGQSELCSTLLWVTCPLPLPLASGSYLSLRKESFSLFPTLQNWQLIWPFGGAAFTSDSSCCWKGQISGHLPSCESCTGAAALLEHSVMLRNAWHNKGIVCFMYQAIPGCSVAPDSTAVDAGEAQMRGQSLQSHFRLLWLLWLFAGSSFNSGKWVQTIFCFLWLRMQPQGGLVTALWQMALLPVT